MRPEAERVVDIGESLDAAAGAVDRHDAIAEDAAEDRLVDVDALDLRHVHLDRVAVEDAALVDHPPVADGELGEITLDEAAQPEDDRGEGRYRRHQLDD